MPRGQKSKLNARGRRRRARNVAQASEGTQERVEAAEQSSRASCRRARNVAQASEGAQERVEAAGQSSRASCRRARNVAQASEGAQERVEAAGQSSRASCRRARNVAQASEGAQERVEAAEQSSRASCRRARNVAQASEGAQERVEAAEQSSRASCRRARNVAQASEGAQERVEAAEQSSRASCRRARNVAQASEGAQERVEAAEQSSRASCRRARNVAQASEGAQERVEAAEQSSPASCRTFNMPEKESIFNIPSDILSFNISDESSISDLDDDDDIFGDYPLINRQQDVLARKIFMLSQLLLDNYKIKQLTTMEEMMKVIDKEEINDFPEILRKTAERLAVIYAVELREVESSRHVYDLISKLKLPNNGRVRPGKGLPKTGFLMTVLGMIVMNDYSVDEEDMWRMLRSMGVYPGKKHPIYGEPRKLITQDFVKLKYLEYQQVANSDPPCYQFVWGPKAYAETSEISVLKFATKINKISYGYFKDHYEAALKEEQRRNQSSQEVSAKTSKTSLRPLEICPLFTPLPGFRDILFPRK